MKKLLLNMLIILMLLGITASCAAEEVISSPANGTEPGIQSETDMNAESNAEPAAEEMILPEPEQAESVGEFQNSEVVNEPSFDPEPQVVETKMDAPSEPDQSEAVEHSEPEPERVVKEETSEANVPVAPEKTEAQDRASNSEEGQTNEKKNTASNETSQMNAEPEPEPTAPAVPGNTEAQNGTDSSEEEQVNEKKAAENEGTDQLNAAAETEPEPDTQPKENEVQETNDQPGKDPEQIAETVLSEEENAVLEEETPVLNETDNVEEAIEMHEQTEDAEEEVPTESQEADPSEPEEQNYLKEAENSLEEENQSEGSKKTDDSEIVAFIAKADVEIFPNSNILEGMAFSLKARIADANEAYVLRWERHDPAADKPEEAPVWEKIGEGEILNLIASLDLNTLDHRLVVTGEDGTELKIAVQHLNIIPVAESEELPAEEPAEELIEETEPEESELPAEEQPEETDQPQPVEEKTDVQADEADELPEEKPRRVIIHSSAGTCIVNGAPIILTVELEGFENDAELTVIWEINKGEGWEEAGTGETFEYLASLESLSWDFRVKVQYTL